jgi:hypothetical protein
MLKMSKKFIYYPEKDDPLFYEKITKKKEFYLNRQKKYEGSMDELCKKDNDEFKLLPQQHLLKNLISPNSPYKNLLVIHGTGSGKCVYKNTKILILKDGLIKYENIEDMWNNYSELDIEYDNDGGEWSNIKKEIKVKSLNDKKELIWCKIKKLYRQKVSEKLNIIKFKNNEIIITKQHHLLSILNNKLSWTNNFERNKDLITFIDNKLEVSRIELLEELYYEGYVYDIEVERYHNYVGNNIICHNTCTAIQIAENFKNYLIRINERINKELIEFRNKPTIYILGNDSSQNNFKDELLSQCGNYKYITKNEAKKLHQLRIDTSEESIELYKKKLREYHKRLTTRSRGGFYNFLGYRDFQNRSIGEKIKIDGKAIRDESGKWKRKIKEPSIKTVDNCLIIVDEAHNLVNSSEPNDYAKAIINVYKKSKNVRLILLTATPITHRPKEIIEILNIVRLDKNEKLLNYKDFIINDKLLPGAEKKIEELSKGYISYLRGYNIYTYPKKINMGILPKNKGFKYTKLFLCPMSLYHYNTYKNVYHGKIQKHEWNLLNMVFPNPNNSKVGLFRNSEISDLINSSNDFKRKHGIEFRTLSSGDKQLSGPILYKDNIKKYSDKFYTFLNNIDDSINNDNGHIFIYSKIVEGTGTRLIKQILLMNGYEEYIYGGIINTSKNISIDNDDDTLSSTYNNIKCYYCGITGKNHNNYINKLKKNKFKSGEKIHQYYPARFIVFDRDTENRIIKNIIDEFNSDDNKDCHIIKMVIGSPKTREAIDFKRINYIHIMTYHDNYATLEQIIGRGARHCSHADLEEDKRKVKIYRYVSSLPIINEQGNKNALSYEEQKYLEGEKYHIIIKKIERILKRSAIDCTLNKSANIFREEVKKYKDCETKKNPIKCSELCDYTNCDYKCKYELSSNKPLNFSDLDTSTYDIYYYYNELQKLKNYIIKLFRINIVWTLDTIIYNLFGDYINILNLKTSNIKNYNLIKTPEIKLNLPNLISKKSISIDNIYNDIDPKIYDELEQMRLEMEYIDIKYIYIALHELITNKNKIYNYYNNPGYIIKRNIYYIFQPFNIIDENIHLSQRNIPLYKYIETELNINNYIKKYYSSIDRFATKINYIDIKNKIKQISISNYSLISKLIGKLNMKNQVAILENAIEISNSSDKLSNDDKMYTRKIFRFFEGFLIDNSKYSGRYNYKRSSQIVDELYDNPNIKIVGHLLFNDPKCYIAGKWISCIYELFGKTRKNTIKKYKNNNFIIGYIDKTKHGKMVFKLKYTKPNKILSKDKRQKYKGFICNQHSNKKELLKIGELLKINDFNIKSTINNICDKIEMKLRENEIEERNKKSNIKWFYEYIEKKLKK